MKQEELAALSSEPDQAVSGINFTKVGDYTMFDAEYAFIGNAIVVHLFQPYDREHDPAFWQGTVGNVLDSFAQEFWEASFPRLMAAYTDKLDSWWFKALGFADQGDPEARVHKFFEGLDQALEAAA